MHNKRLERKITKHRIYSMQLTRTLAIDLSG